MNLLKASFLLPIKSIRVLSALENQSGLFLSDLVATFLAHCTMCDSNLSSSSVGIRNMASDGVSSLKKSFTPSLKPDRPVSRRMMLLIFFGGGFLFFTCLHFLVLVILK